MARPLRVLLVEDSPEDAAIALRELKRAGYDVVSERVDTEASLLAALARQEWDIVLSDFAMPDFSGLHAFELIKEREIDVPFIFVSGQIGEDRAAEAMKRGASDYVLKNKLARLGPAVQRELEDAEARRQRRQMLKSLQERERQLTSIYDTVGDVIFQLAVEKDGRYRFASLNPAFFSVTGLPLDLVIGKRVDEVVPEPSLSLVLGKYAEAIRERKIVRWEETSDYPKGRLTGEVSVAPIFDEAGTCTHLVGAVHDITARKASEERLREREERYRTLVESTPNALVIVDEQGRITEVNSQTVKWFGFQREEIIGQLVEVLMPERYREHHMAIRSEYLKNPKVHPLGTDRERFGLRRDGSEFPVDISLSPFRSKRGLEVIAEITDITDRIRAEQSIRESEERFRNLIERSIQGTTIVQDGRVAFCNDRFAEFYGYRTAAEMIGREALSLVHPDDREKALAFRDAVLKEGIEHQQFGYRGIRKDGSVIWLESLRQRLDWYGKPAVQSAIMDVTERVAQEQRIRESEERYRSLIEGSVFGIAIVQDGRLAFCNDTYAGFFGYESAEDLIGRESLPLIHPEDREPALASRNALLRGESTDVRFEYRGVRKDGRQFLAETLRRCIDWNGRPAVQGAILDVTSHREAERKLHESEERYRSLVERSILGIVIIQDGRFAYCNDTHAKLHGFETGKDLIGTDPLLLLHPDDQERGLATRNALLSGETTSYRIEYRGVRKDGLEIWLDAVFHRIDWQGRPATQGAILDVTAHRTLERQLQTAQRMESIGRLAGGIAHDFNNILAVISAHSGFLLDVLEKGTQAWEDAQIVQQSGTKAAALTRQLLAFSRKQVMQLQVLNINETVGDLEKMLRRMIGEDIELHTHYGSDLMLIQADESQIEQVAMNLLVNARDAMPIGGEVTIETSNETLDENYVKTHLGAKPGEYVMLAVTDTGTGMSEEIQQRIFEPFFTTKAPGKGTGLGLATVYGIVKQMNGSIYVYSELGKGTTFKIYFPVTREGQAGEQKAADAAPVRSVAETILVVEDDELVRRAAVRILKGRGYRVLESTSPEEGIEIARTHPGEIHLLLSDVVMPGLSGRELLERIKAIRDVPVLFMSGYTDDAIINHGILEGRFPFLNKPFTKESLLTKVREVLDG